MFSDELKQKIPSLCTFFEAALQKDKLSHAYLFCGSDSELKYNFALELTQILNCENNTPALNNKTVFQKPCQKCRNCLWLQQNTHPELPIILEPDLEKSKKGLVLVKQVQELLGKLQYKSNFYRTVFIKKAESEFLPAESANSLLKTIEEPNSNILFLLFAFNSEAVLPTITSRCQIIHFPNLQTQNTNLELKQMALEVLNNLNQKNNWFQISQIAAQVADSQNSLIDFLDILISILIEQKKASVFSLENLEKAKSRLKAFCAPKPVLEELFWNLSLK